MAPRHHAGRLTVSALVAPVDAPENFCLDLYNHDLPGTLSGLSHIQIRHG
jgi:hypothetical protein